MMWLRRLLIFAITAVLILLLGRGVWDFWAGRQVRAVEARLVQKYGSLDVRTLNAPPVPANVNRARAIRAAAALMVDPYAVQESLTRFFRERPAELPADLRAFVESNGSALRVANEARARSGSNWEIDHSGSNAPRWLDIRALSNAVYVSALVDLESGRTADAAETVATGLAVSSSIRQEHNLIAQLIRQSVGIQHFEAAQRLLTQSEPSPGALEELAKRLAENRIPNPAHVGLLSEMKQFNAQFARLEDGLAADMPRLADARSSAYWPGIVPGLRRPAARHARLRYLEQMEHLLEIQGGPRPRPAANLSVPRWTFLRPIFEVAGPALARTMETADLFNSELALTELAVALRRYRIDHGTYPDELSVLVPAYVPGVPIDPFTGKPHEYERQGAGFRLRGENGSRSSGLTAAALSWSVPK